MATTPTIQPGQTIQMNLTSTGPISTEFAGKTLIAAFALPNGSSKSVPMVVAQIPAPSTAPVLSAQDFTGYADLSWTDVSGALNYQLYHTDSSGTPLGLIAQVTGTSYQVFGPVGSILTVAVRACNDGGCGQLSAPVTVFFGTSSSSGSTPPTSSASPTSSAPPTSSAYA